MAAVTPYVELARLPDAARSLQLFGICFQVAGGTETGAGRPAEGALWAAEGWAIALALQGLMEGSSRPWRLSGW